MKRLAIIGTKELSMQITGHALYTKEFSVVGYYDDIAEKGTKLINGLHVLGNVLEDAFDDYQKGLFDCIFISIGYSRFDLREYYYHLVKGRIPLANIILPTAYISPSARLGEGIFVGPQASIDDRSIVKDNVFIHGSTTITHDCIVEEHSYFSGRCDLAGFCHIGKRNFVGIRVCFADHITTCDDVWTGIGCIVAKDIKHPGKYMSPAAKLYKIE